MARWAGAGLVVAVALVSACVGGVCGACSSDTDCCGLEVCYNGLCVPLLL